MPVQFPVLTRRPSGPGIVLEEGLRVDKAITQRGAPGGIIHDPCLDVVHPDPLDPGGGAIEIARFLTVKLDEGRAVFERLLLGGDLAQQIGAAQLDPAIAADAQFVAAINADHPEILDRGFGAIARTARDRDLELVRHIAAPGQLLDPDAQPGRILRSEPAPFGADASFHRAQRLGIGMAADHARGVEIGPDRGQIFLADAEDIDPLPAGDLDRACLSVANDTGIYFAFFNAAGANIAQYGAFASFTDYANAMNLTVGPDFHGVSTKTDGSKGVFYKGVENTNIQGSNLFDDLLIFNGGANYDGGERANDADMFVADFRSQTIGVTFLIDDAVATSYTMENGVHIAGIDRAFIKFNNDGNLARGGRLRATRSPAMTATTTSVAAVATTRWRAAAVRTC